MLKRFEVKNFKGFKDKLVFDLSATREYAFNTEFICNNIVNKALVYGKNGTGKSNLGQAIFDITWHLTEKRKINTVYAYLNGDSPRNSVASFKYTFQFGDAEVIYEYEKHTPINLRLERLLVNKQEVIYYNHENKESRISIPEASTLNAKLDRNDQSIIRYIYRNSILGSNSPIEKMMTFVDNMLWFRSLSFNEFSGYKSTPTQLAEMIGSEENLQKFAAFLEENDLHYNLKFENDIINNIRFIAAAYENNIYPLNTISSQGTEALLLFYCWSLEFDKISFLFLDEFDAFYHYETAEYVLGIINKHKNFQSVVTTHNTSLLNNRLTRPDCCYIISHGAINNLSNCTEKEIREAHNLEKMYRNGTFDQ